MFAGLGKARKLALARELFQNATNRDITWQREAREDFAFRDGYQWTSQERQIMEEELRPVLTMNLTKSSCDLIMGMNEDNKQIYHASPSEPTDEFLAEVLNDVTDWVNDRFEFELEEDAALESAVICGRGFVGIDFLPDPDRFGEILLQQVNIPVSEIHFDPASRRPGFTDASYFCWDRWLTRHDFQMRWPNISRKKIEELIELAGMKGYGQLPGPDQPQGSYEVPHDISDPDDNDYTDEIDYEWYDRNANMIRIVHMEYWEMYKRYFIFNPETGGFEEIESKPTKEQKEEFLASFGEEMTIEEITDKKVKWLIFAGDRILYDDDSPLPYKGFSVVPVTAYRDASGRTSNHYGIVRLMKDPQKEVNKRWSQTLNMLNQQVQSGLFAEMGAFPDIRQAEQSIKEPGSITFLNDGAIAGGKIQERALPTFPNAPMQMEQYSQEIIKKITGINPDLLGQDRGRQEPGVVVRLRQQQGITLLKPLFRNFNSMKKELYKRQLAIVMEYMPDDQILRILGQNDRYQIDPEKGIITDSETEMTADLRNVRDLEFNIISEPSSGNMSKRMMELTALLEMGQTLPVPPEQIIEKMDIAVSEKTKWLKYIEEQQQQQQQLVEHQLQTDMQKFEREQGAKEKDSMLKFVLGIAKLKQMAEKDEKSMVKDFEALDVQEQQSTLQMAANIIKVANDATQAQADRQVQAAQLLMQQGGENEQTQQTNGQHKTVSKKA